MAFSPTGSQSRSMTASTFSGDEIGSLMPNLPGFRSNKQPSISSSASFKKKTFFKVVHGTAIVKDDSGGDAYNDDDSSTILSIGSSKKSPVRDFGIVLTYDAYFEEFPDGLQDGERQIRKVKIYYFLEDDTMKIVEKPQVNSGTMQGVLVRRGAIKKDDGSFVSLYDLRIGEPVSIFKRTYHIVDMDASTRQYLMDLGFDDDDPESVPEDSYQQYRISLQKEKGDLEKDWAKFHSKKNDTKTFADAMMGVLVDNSGREGFIKFGRDTLNFKCVWDNTHNLYGDKMEYSLAYYLADDTIEIVALSSSSKQKLLKRAKLPKDFGTAMTLGERPKADEFFRFSDLYIGLQLEVYGRTLELVDADRKTREFYEEQEMPLGQAILPEKIVVAPPKREIPPPTGFGSEEDSMRSVSGSLMPGPVPAKKLGENKIISFFASLLSGGIDDVERRFVLSYYVSDSTLKIQEPPVRNSGFTGGLFLSRREIKKEDGTMLKFSDMYIGCKLKVLKHVFLLLDSNHSTLKWLEDQYLPRSSYYTILDKIRPACLEHAKSGTLFDLFSSEETPESPGEATVDTLRMIFSRYQLTGDHPDDVSEHEMRTILRGAGNKKSTFKYAKFIDELIHPTDFFK